MVNGGGYIHITDLMTLVDEEGIDFGTLQAIYEEYILSQQKTKRINEYYLIGSYLAAIIAANLLVARFGPNIAIINAFVFIGLDLTTRDFLHERWKVHLWAKMGALIAAGSILSFAFNRASGQIALASFVAFATAGIADTVTYWLLGDKSRFLKINGSNVASSAVDSLLFPLIAFGWPPLWPIILGQFTAKIGGGFVWSLILRSLTNETNTRCPMGRFRRKRRRKRIR